MNGKTHACRNINFAFVSSCFTTCLRDNILITQSFPYIRAGNSSKDTWRELKLNDEVVFSKAPSSCTSRVTRLCNILNMKFINLFICTWNILRCAIRNCAKPFHATRHLVYVRKIFSRITFRRSLEIRLNSVAKRTEFCAQAFRCLRTTCSCHHIGEHKKHQRVVNTNSNFWSGKVKNVLRPKGK